MWSRKFGTLGLIQSGKKKMCFKIDPGRNADHSVPPIGFFCCWGFVLFWFGFGGFFCIFVCLGFFIFNNGLYKYVFSSGIWMVLLEVFRVVFFDNTER